MSRLAKSFDTARAQEAGSLYARKHYGVTLLWIAVHRWGDVFGLVAFVLFVLWMGKR